MKIRENVKELVEIEGIETALSSRKDGILLYCKGKEAKNAEVIAAMIATFLGSAEKVTSVLEKGKLTNVVMEMEQGRIIATEAGPENFLAVITTPEANFQLVSLELLRAVKKIEETE